MEGARSEGDPFRRYCSGVSFASRVEADSVCGEAVEGVLLRSYPPGSGPLSGSVIRWCLPCESALRT